MWPNRTSLRVRSQAKLQATGVQLAWGWAAVAAFLDILFFVAAGPIPPYQSVHVGAGERLRIEAVTG